VTTGRIVAIVAITTVVALAIGATFGYSISPPKTTSTSVTTETIQTTATSLVTQVIVKSSSNSLTGELYELRFNQTGVCNPPIYIIPWSVTLSNGMTITEPSPGTGPVSECCSGSPSSNYSSIIFSVPNGSYSYSVGGRGTPFYPLSGSPTTGNVTVNGDDMTVLLNTEIEVAGQPVFHPPLHLPQI